MLFFGDIILYFLFGIPFLDSSDDHIFLELKTKNM